MKYETGKVSIIILNYNGYKYTKDLLDSLFLTTIISKFEVILVDNYSSDLEQRRLQHLRRKDLKIILLDKNKGVAGGRNEGIKAATGEFIVFLDNDIILKQGWIFEILESFNRLDVGIVGKNGVYVNSLSPIDFKNSIYIQKNLAEVDAVSGFCFAFRAKLITEIGFLNDELPNPLFWHEDLEYCLRAKMAGYKVICKPTINLLHYGHKSMGENTEAIHEAKNQFGFKENAKKVKELHQKVNTYHTNTNVHSNAAFARLLRARLEYNRKNGIIAIVKEGIKTSVQSYDLCRAWDLIDYKGNRIVHLFQENSIAPISWNKELDQVDYIEAGSPFLATTIPAKYRKKIISKFPKAGFLNKKIYTQKKSVKPFDKFTFLTVGAAQLRKSTRELIALFASTFTNNPEVQLIVKTGQYGDFEISAYCEAVAEEYNVTIQCIRDDYTDLQMAELYSRTALNGVYIHPHKAECLGMPIVEALSCMCRIITSNYAGPMYILKTLDSHTELPYHYLINGELVHSRFHNWAGEPFYGPDENPQWFIPMQSELVNAIRDAYENKKLVDVRPNLEIFE